MTSMKEKYQKEVVPELVKKFEYGNINQVPKIEKVILNAGIGNKQEREVLGEAVKLLTTITGQKAVETKARKSIANFKLREGQSIGTKVTLRGHMMYDFLTRLIHNALPRVRDFRGVKKNGFDGSGNYTMGINDQSIFTEIDLDKIKHTIGMNITVVTTAKSDEEGRELLTLIGMPFAK